MQTLKEKEEEVYSRDDSYYFSDGYVSHFMQGVEFAQRWIEASEPNLPIGFESGGWDGLKSDMVLAKDKFNKIHLAITYQGVLDGRKFCEWVDIYDNVIFNVISWRPITVS